MNNTNATKQMEYSRNELSKAVYYVLLLNPNKRFTTAELLDQIDLENVCPEFTSRIFTRSSKTLALNELSDTISKVAAEYNNVYYTDNVCYLRQRSKHVEFLEPILKSEKSNTVDIYSPDYDGDSLIHLLCKDGEEDELLEAISKYHKIDVCSVNAKGQSLFDVIANGDQKTLKTLVKLVLKQSQQSQQHYDSVLKEATNMTNSLIISNVGLVKHRQLLDSKIEKLSTWNNRLSVVIVVLLVTLVSTVMHNLTL